MSSALAPTTTTTTIPPPPPSPPPPKPTSTSPSNISQAHSYHRLPPLPTPKSSTTTTPVTPHTTTPTTNAPTILQTSQLSQLSTTTPDTTITTTTTATTAATTQSTPTISTLLPSSTPPTTTATKLQQQPELSPTRLSQVQSATATPPHQLSAQAQNQSPISSAKSDKHIKDSVAAAQTPQPPQPNTEIKKPSRARKTPSSSATRNNKDKNANLATPSKELKVPKKPARSRASSSKSTTSVTSSPVKLSSAQDNKTSARAAAAAVTSQASLSNATPTLATDPATPATASKKRKSRSTSNDTSNLAAPVVVPPAPLASPTPKRQRKKKEPATKTPPTNGATLPLNISNPPLLSVASTVSLGVSSPMTNAPLPPTVNNRLMPGMGPIDAHDPNNRFYSLTISPYSNYDYSNASSLTRPSLSRLFTASSAEQSTANSHSDEIVKALDELRDQNWSHLSRCILEQAQQFDIPALIGSLYTLRQENEKLTNKVKDLTIKKEQLVAMNARLDLPGPMLTQHLSHTSPNFSSVVSGLTNSPKSLPNSSPSPATNKSPLAPGGLYGHHVPSGALGPPGFLDRSSPMINLPGPYAGVNSFKPSSISTPSPPIHHGTLMAHGANNRAGLTTINNHSYMSNVHPPTH